MKKQNSSMPNAKAEFLDLKGAKNPFYQAMAGKVNLSAEDKTAPQGGAEKQDIREGNKVGGAHAEMPKFPAAFAEPEASREEKKEEVKEEAIVPKRVLNLEGTLKLVAELHRRMVQRGRLVHTIDNLDKFEIEQKQEAEDTSSNYYQGCELELTDDKRNKFSTKNPVIIKAVALFVRDLCTNRLAEIEAEITIPS